MASTDLHIPFPVKFSCAIFCIYKDVWATSVSLQRTHTSVAFALPFLVFAEFVLSWFGIYAIGSRLIDTSEPIPGRLSRVSYSFCMMG